MMRIQLREMDSQCTFQVEGRLAGAWVSVLDDSWQAARKDHPNKKFSVDLTGVTFIDQAGWYLLQLMYRDGVSFSGAGLKGCELLDRCTPK